MNLLQIINKESFLNEKETFTDSEECQFELNEIQKHLDRANITLDELEKAFDLNREGKLSDYTFEKNSKKVQSYTKCGLRYVSEIIFAYSGWKRNEKKYKVEIMELPEIPKMTTEESFAKISELVKKKFRDGEKDLYKLSAYIHQDFFNFIRNEIDLSIPEQQVEVDKAVRWLKGQESIKPINDYSITSIIKKEIKKSDARRLAMSYLVVKYILK